MGNKHELHSSVIPYHTISYHIIPNPSPRCPAPKNKLYKKRYLVASTGKNLGPAYPYTPMLCKSTVSRSGGLHSLNKMYLPELSCFVRETNKILRELQKCNTYIGGLNLMLTTFFFQGMKNRL